MTNAIMLHGREFISPFAIHTIKGMMDTSGFVVTIHVAPCPPADMPKEKVPQPVYHEVRCQDEEHLKDEFCRICDKVVAFYADLVMRKKMNMAVATRKLTGAEVIN